MKRSNGRSVRCPKSFSPTPLSRTSRSRSRSSVAAAILALVLPVCGSAATLAPVVSRDKKVIKRWSLTGDPRGVAIGDDGTVYVGLAKPQSIVAIDPKSDRVVNEVVLDSAEIASTKELVTLRLTPDRSRLVVANGSDESVTILALPQLKILREIGLEGEAIRDALPDPKGRYIYVLGRTVHVYDAAGETEIRNLSDIEPMAIATNDSGSMLVVVGSETFENGAATVAVFYDPQTLKETGREPLQTDRTIQSALFAAGDRALVVLARDWFGEKALEKRPAKALSTDPAKMKMTIEFGDLINSESICLPDMSGPQVALVAAGGRSVVFAEKRCAASNTFSASKRLVAPASLYGVPAWGLAFDAVTGAIYATEPSGFLTSYRIPKMSDER